LRKIKHFICVSVLISIGFGAWRQLILFIENMIDPRSPPVDASDSPSKPKTGGYVFQLLRRENGCRNILLYDVIQGANIYLLDLQ